MSTGDEGFREFSMTAKRETSHDKTCDECEQVFTEIGALCPFCGCCGACCNCPPEKEGLDDL